MSGCRFTAAGTPDHPAADRGLGSHQPSNPSVDEALVQKLMPARALGMKMAKASTTRESETRSSCAGCRKPKTDTTPTTISGQRVFADQQTMTEKGRVVGIRYGSSASIGPQRRQWCLLNWPAEKFQAKELRVLARGTGPPDLGIKAMCGCLIGLRDKMISVDMRSGRRAGPKAMFNQEHYSKPATADKNLRCVGLKVNVEDLGVTEKAFLQKPHDQ